MKKPVTHLICNAHLDPVWQWRWDEGAAEAITTFSIAVRLLKEFPTFVFNHDVVNAVAGPADWLSARPMRLPATPLAMRLPGNGRL
jgi:hypothetical protein